MKALVVYFSRAGENSVNGEIKVIEKGWTEIVAEKIAKYVNAQLYKLDPVVPYPFEYRECVKRAEEEKHFNPFVEWKNPIDNIDEYDIIYLGFPSWYRTYPRIISCFLSKYSFNGKTIMPFCTNEEGSFGIGELELRSQLKNANVKDGFSVRGYKAETCDENLKKWLGV